MREESLLGWDGSLPHREFKNATSTTPLGTGHVIQRLIKWDLSR